MKKLVCSLLIILITFSLFGQIAGASYVENMQKSDYVVIAKDNSIAEDLAKDFNGAVLESDGNICSIYANSYEIAVLDRDYEIERVEEDVIFEASSEESSEIGVNQWYLDAISVDSVEVSNSIKVEILDSGIDYSEDYNLKGTVNLVPDDNESVLFGDSTGHGSSIAGIIGAFENESGITGINPAVELYSVRVLDSNNQAPLSRIVEGIYWGIENDMQIINMSFGTSIDSEILHNAIRDAYDAGILLIAAAGNTNHQSVQYPAAYDEVISVGSVNANGELSEMTSIDETLDILAPGENILTTTFLDTVSTVSGTSVATAQVSGVASLLWARDPNKSHIFIKELICNAVNKPDVIADIDVGILNFEAANNAYEQFTTSYKELKENSLDFKISENFDYSEEAAITVDGLWNNSENGHKGISDAATEYASFSGNAPKIVRYACTHLDANKYVGGDGKIVGGPHGSGNYVINLRFLFLASRCIYDNGVGDEYKTLVENFKNNESYWDVSWGSKNYDYKRFVALVEQVDAFLETYDILETDIKANFDNYSRATKDKYLGTMIFGMALHLAGDIYAHRAIVPKYTIRGVNGTENSTNADGKDMFGTKYFAEADSFDDSTATRKDIKKVCLENDPKEINYSIAYWQHFQRGVSLQVVEFRDIKMFLSSSSNPFEDNSTFCEERYYASLLSCKRLAARFKEAGSFYTKLIYPKLYSGTDAQNEKYQYVKLNNFKNYTIASGLAYIGVDLSEADWEINSTTNLV